MCDASNYQAKRKTYHLPFAALSCFEIMPSMLLFNLFWLHDQCALHSLSLWEQQSCHLWSWCCHCFDSHGRCWLKLCAVGRVGQVTVLQMHHSILVQICCCLKGTIFILTVCSKSRFVTVLNSKWTVIWGTIQLQSLSKYLNSSIHRIHVTNLAEMNFCPSESSPELWPSANGIYKNYIGHWVWGIYIVSCSWLCCVWSGNGIPQFLGILPPQMYKVRHTPVHSSPILKLGLVRINIDFY
jgi:hypothetical protein